MSDYTSANNAIENAYRYVDALGFSELIDNEKLVASIESASHLFQIGVIDKSTLFHLLNQIVTCPRGIEDIGQFDHTYIIKQPIVYADDTAFESLRYCFLRLALEAEDKYGSAIVSSAMKKAEKEYRKSKSKGE